MSRVPPNQRVSALKRLGSSNSSPRPLMAGGPSVRDARQLLTQRKQTPFDARQVLSRHSSNDGIFRNQSLPTKTIINETIDNGKMVVITGLKDMKVKDGRLISNAGTDPSSLQKKKQIFAVGSSTFVTIRNPANQPTTVSNPLTEKISLTKTINNPSARPEVVETIPRLSDQKVLVRVVNDQYKKNLKLTAAPTTTRSLSPIEPAPISRRLHDASIQTSQSSSLAARPPIRINAHHRDTSTTTSQTKKRALSEDEDNNIDDLDDSQEEFYEPPVKRTSSSIRKAPRDEELPSTSASMKRISTAASSSSRLTSTKSVNPASNVTTGTILVTNLQPSVTEEDVIELFGQVGQINGIKTLSRGCIQIVFERREYAEQAVTKYHNRLLDGQFMYVSLQQPVASPQPTKPLSSGSISDGKSSATNSKETGMSSQPLKFNSNTSNNSNKIVIDPVFMRQALFHPSNNTANPVQFQVKL